MERRLRKRLSDKKFVNNVKGKSSRVVIARKAFYSLTANLSRKTSRTETCRKCHGTRTFKQGGHKRRCRHCGGRGKVQYMCNACNGHGVQMERTSLEIEIPKGGTVDGTIAVPDVGDKMVNI